jgi:Domain of unknown function (DUF4157)
MHGHGKRRQQPPAQPRTAAPARQQDATAGLSDRLTPESAAALQRTAGNAAVARMLRQQRDAEGAESSGPGPASVQRNAVQGVLRGSGRALDDEVRSDMESRLGADFSDVRLHTGPDARRSAAEIGARAYTSGNHVVIGDGGADRHTLAHELTHVIQQRQGPVAGTDNGGGLSVSDPSDAFERAAEANARRAMARTSSAPIATGGRTAPGRADTLQRFLDPNVGDTAEAKEAARTYLYDNLQSIFVKYRGSYKAALHSDLDTRSLVKDLSKRAEFASEFAKPELFMAAVQKLLARTPEDLPSAQMSALVRMANVLEQEAATESATREDPKSAPLAHVRIGTEFTFSNQQLRLLRLDLDTIKDRKQKADAQRVLTAAESAISNWTGYVLGHELPNLKVEKKPATGTKSAKAVTFVYTSAKGDFEWDWTLDLDEGCLETQTKPTTVAGLKEHTVQNILDQHVFGAADQLGLKADTTTSGGGGHISVDATTAFGGSAELFTETVRTLEEGYEEWRAYLGERDRGQTDKTNAQWLNDLPHSEVQRITGLLADVKNDALAGRADVASAAVRLRDQIKSLPVSAQAAPERQDHIAEERNRAHYQAVNIEHMSDENEGSRRVELRDVPAQRGTKDLQSDLDEITRQFSDARSAVREALTQRLSDRHAG